MRHDCQHQTCVVIISSSIIFIIVISVIITFVIGDFPVSESDALFPDFLLQLCRPYAYPLHVCVYCVVVVKVVGANHCSSKCNTNDKIYSACSRARQSFMATSRTRFRKHAT